ncbi:hypothetical protein HA402_001549 [Bradysia odoriphaga]|nr:hypothetical protein HA402_001549 [Bradysia odoriphaga]
MPGCDWIPGIAQLKSTVQLLTGDTEGAARTQQNFIRECPVVSQVTSVVQLASGDKKGAKETQKRCLGTINNVANGLPVVGHVKGVIHHAVGDHEGGNQALNAATRTTVVLGAGAAAAVATGGLAAIPAGIAAGSTYDTVDSVISDKPKGIVSAICNVKDNPNGGNFFDAGIAIVGDGMTGYAGGNIGTKIANNVKVGQLEAAQASKVEQLTNGLGEMPSGDAIKLGNEITSLGNEINAIKNQGVPQHFYDVKTKQHVVETSGGQVNVGPVTGLEQPGTSGERPGTSGERPGTSGERPGTSGEQPGHSGEGLRPRPQQTAQVIEDGFDCDLYADEPLTCNLSPARKDEILRHYKDQIPQEKQITNQHPNSRLSTQAELNRLGQDRQPPQNTTSESIAELQLQLWLPLQMPQQFRYTSAGLLNDTQHGFLHTFARHWDQWSQFIPEISSLMRAELSILQPVLRRIQSARNPQAARDANQELTRLLASCSDGSLLATLRRLQILIWKYMQDRMVSANYIGEGLNGRGQVQVYFRVGNQIMVVCVSRELYPAVPAMGDGRPIRTVTTVFFIDPATLVDVLIRAIWN